MSLAMKTNFWFSNFYYYYYLRSFTNSILELEPSLASWLPESWFGSMKAEKATIEMQSTGNKQTNETQKSINPMLRVRIFI